MGKIRFFILFPPVLTPAPKHAIIYSGNAGIPPATNYELRTTNYELK